MDRGRFDPATDRLGQYREYVNPILGNSPTTPPPNYPGRPIFNQQQSTANFPPTSPKPPPRPPFLANPAEFAPSHHQYNQFNQSAPAKGVSGGVGVGLVMPPQPGIPHHPQNGTGVTVPPDKGGGGDIDKAANNDTTLEFKSWDVFRLLPPKSGDHKRGFWLDISLHLLKLITYPVVFTLLLASAVTSKATFLFMTSAIGLGGKNITLCPGALDNPRNATVILETRHTVKYVWAVFFTLCAPELFCFVRCLQRIFFRNVRKPSLGQFFTTFLCETLVCIGIGTLAFRILPEMDAVSGAMFMSSLMLVPSIFGLLSRKAQKLSLILIVLDIIAIAGQSSCIWAIPIFVPDMIAQIWAIPIAGVLCSFAYWENYVHKDSVFPCIRALARLAERLKQVRSKTYVVVAPWKCFIYFCSLFAFMSMRMDIRQLLEPDPFGAKSIQIVIHNPVLPNRYTPDPYSGQDPLPLSGRSKGFLPPPPSALSQIGLPSSRTSTLSTLNEPLNFIDEEGDPLFPTLGTISNRSRREVIYEDSEYSIQLFFTTPLDALWVFLIAVLTGFFCYQCAKFACKVTMQRLCFALPLNLSSLVLVLVLNTMCFHRIFDSCFFGRILPYEIYWNCPKNVEVIDFFADPKTWFWVVWFLTQTWVTIHIWLPKCERLADTDRLFVLPWYSGAIIDQTLALNRNRDDTIKIKTEEIELDTDAPTSIYDTISTGVISMNSFGMETPTPKQSNTLPNKKSMDGITRIYACATMWHETREEMLCMLKSIFRLDEDQCARRNAQKYLKVVDPDYYEFEAHIMFDDAFETNEYGEPVVNRFVRQLLEVIDIAAGAVHQITMRIKAPKKFSSPYGGRLQWTLPGKNRLTVHLKDKNKIRNRKRWSQVMYMYYLLGHRLMECVGETKRKENIAENTFILTLDGDVDFQPGSVQLLVDLMKKNRKLGAACGRIHPRGTGPMVWYQKFEYAIGHWFQKATEHMIGCVLCSPGCFSLFRSSALMDDNVLRRYATKAEKGRDYIQYDQGEDRWLCTLLLQRGYRVEYSAASDALTFAPQSFTEFFNQRRRWVPSTIANIMDLLSDYKSVVKVNDSISIWYICYQFAMLLSSILGPGTIFLMVAGAVNISFSNSTTMSFIFVLLPVLLFMVCCFTCKPETQLIVAQVISAWFAMLMMAVIVGTALQIKKDGITSPHAIFMLCLIASAFIAACLHPLEFTCVIPGILYFLAIPCTYMLLAIYSVCNLHVVSWGTREVKDNEVHDKGKKKSRNLHILENGEPASVGEIDGVYSVGCGSACRVLCCIKPSEIGDSPAMARLTEKLDQMDRKIDRFDRKFLNRRSSIGIGDGRMDAQPLLEAEEDELADDHFDLPYHEAQKEKAAQSDSWLNERCMRHAERDWLEPDEERFWVQLIDKFLYPLKKVENEEQVRVELHSLRNQISFGFYMTNALFILVVFLLQLKKDCLNVEWPLGPKFNRSFVPCNSETGDEEWQEVGLQLEPIGFVFLFFFMSLLVIQFFAMLMHRFGTLSHILAATELFCFRKTIDRLSEDELVAEHAVEIARELQAIRGIDDDSHSGTYVDEDEAETTISRRRVVKSLENSRRHQAARRTETLDAAFRKRFFNLKEEERELGGSVIGGPVQSKLGRRVTMRQDTIRAVRSRRDKIYGTLDKATGKQMAAAAANGGEREDEDSDAAPRGPARRRVDRIFHDKHGQVLQNGDGGGAAANEGRRDGGHSDDSEDDDFKIVDAGRMKVSSGLHHTDSWGEQEYGSVRRTGGPNPTNQGQGLPLRKIIAQNAMNVGGGGESGEGGTPRSQRQLLANMGGSTESESSESNRTLNNSGGNKSGNGGAESRF